MSDTKNKPAEEFLDSLNLPVTNSATRIFWEDVLTKFADQTTQSLQKENEEMKLELAKHRLILRKAKSVIADNYWGNVMIEEIDSFLTK